MSKKPAIKQDVISKAWKLHESGVPNDLISYTLGLSDSSIKRIIRLFTAASNGEVIDYIEGDRYHLIKKIAREYFGIPGKKEETKPEQAPDNVDTQEIPSDYRDFMVKILAEICHQNKLIERLLKELGVELT